MSVHNKVSMLRKIITESNQSSPSSDQNVLDADVGPRFKFILYTGCIFSHPTQPGWISVDNSSDPQFYLVREKIIWMEQPLEIK